MQEIESPMDTMHRRMVGKSKSPHYNRAMMLRDRSQERPGIGVLKVHDFASSHIDDAGWAGV